MVGWHDEPGKIGKIFRAGRDDGIKTVFGRDGRNFFQNILIHLSTPPEFSASDKARHRRSGVAGMSTSLAP